MLVCTINVDCDYIIYITRESGSQSRVTQHRKSRAKSFPQRDEGRVSWRWR